MKTVFHAADTRGAANHGWLQAKHSFSFAQYFNPERTQFGVLRVLNDDIIAPGRGFGMHPHDNMEIITIPLKGALEHKDSMNNVGVIEADEIQVMSAGTGVYHSEYNKNADQEVNLLQIWLFPNAQNVTPRYDQKSIADLKISNSLYPVVTPEQRSDRLWIHQNAWFHLGDFTQPTTLNYSLNASGNGVYAFVIEGEVTLADTLLGKRDALGVWDTDSFSLSASENTRILLMEVPMSL
ncbi:MAG: pirin family protein [Flavobacteriaceae bacterium]